MINKLNLLWLMCGILFPFFPNAVTQEIDEEGIRAVSQSYAHAMTSKNTKVLEDLHIEETKNYFLSCHPDSISYGTPSPFEFEFWENYKLRPGIK